MCNVVDMSNVVDICVQCSAWHINDCTQLGNMKLAESWGFVGPQRAPFRSHMHVLGTSLKLKLQTEKEGIEQYTAGRLDCIHCCQYRIVDQE